MSSHGGTPIIFLGVLIFKDLLKQYLFFILLIASVVFAFLIVKQEHEARLIINTLDKENKKQSKLEDEFQHLRLELEVLITHARVENIAEKKLDMEVTEIQSEKVIKLPNNNY